MGTRQLLVGATTIVGLAIVVTAGVLAFGIGINDYECADPNGSTLSKCPAQGQSTAQITTPARSTTIRPTTASRMPSTTQRTVSSTSSRPPAATSTAPIVTTTTTKAIVTTTTARPAPVPVTPQKMGTLDSSGKEVRCGGIPLSVGQTLTNNGVTFSLNAKGPNNSPELAINGKGSYTYPQVLIVTGDDPFVGHTTGVSVPEGEVHRAYDISTPGKTLKGALICS